MKPPPFGAGVLAAALAVAGGACSTPGRATRGTASGRFPATTTVPAQPGAPAGAQGGAQGAGPAGPAPARAGVASELSPGGAEVGKVVVATSVPGSVVRGRLATATFRTRPGSTCQLELHYAGTASSDRQRLDPAVANANGDVSWTWTVSGTATPGDALAEVVCSGGAKGGTRIAVS